MREGKDMKKQKRIVIALALAFIIFSLAGCAKSSFGEIQETLLSDESVVVNQETTETIESEPEDEVIETSVVATAETTIGETNTQGTTEMTVETSETTATYVSPTIAPTVRPTTAPAPNTGSGETTFVCPICGDIYGEQDLYDSHIRNAHVTPTPVPTSTPRPTTAPTATPTPAYTQTRVRETWRSTGRWANNDIELAATYGVTLPTPPTITYVVYQYPDGRRETDLSGSGYSSWGAFENAVFGTTVMINGEEYWCTNYGTYSDGYNGGSGLISSRTEALINGVWQPI